MMDEEFKLEVVQRLARIESGMCDKIATNRKLIYLSLTLYTTSVLGLIINYMGA